MKKQILSLVFLTVLPLVFSVTAAPPGAPDSTEAADRQFLQNLEKADAAKTQAVTATPAPVATKSPAVTAAAKSNPQPATAPSGVIVQKPRTIVLAEDYDAATQPDEIADSQSSRAEAPVTHVTVERPTRVVREHRHTERHPLHHLLRRLLSFHPEDW